MRARLIFICRNGRLPQRIFLNGSKNRKKTIWLEQAGPRGGVFRYSVLFCSLPASEGPMTVFVYINTAKEVGDVDYVKVFANQEAAERWFEENDPEGVTFEYEVLE